MSNRPVVKIALRDWEFLTPLLLGDIRSERIDLVIDRVTAPNLPHAGQSDLYDAAEASFSRYVQIRAAGDSSLVGIPNFILRGFRHRCVITLSGSPLEALAELKGMRIGLTGWQDSGNSWTRAAIRREGVQIEDAAWFVGRLTDQSPKVDRLGRFRTPGLIEAAPNDQPLMNLLEEGRLDAVFTPFMPAGFFEALPRFRQVDRDFRSAERRYYSDVGYVPGIHLLTVKASLAERYPWLPQEISDLVDASRRVWQLKREKYADATPWFVDELIRTSQELPASWGASGFQANQPMIADFVRELYEQGITDRTIAIAELFSELRPA